MSGVKGGGGSTNIKGELVDLNEAKTGIGGD